nr:ATP-binding protein [uncultured Acetatifactor sp.]
MTKRIFRSICLAALGVFLSSAVLFMGVVYDYFSGVQHDQLRMQTQLAAQGAANEGSRYFEGLEVEGFRITWIGAKGEVLYDSASDSAEMENHMERDEIREAFAGGSGESSRYSVTLLERAIYCAERLPDGTVLRLSMAQNTPLTLFLGILQPVCIVFAVAVLLSLFLAFRLSRAIVKPLNELDLDQPLMNQEYEEIVPLLKRMSQQQRQIRKQREELRRRQSEFETVTTGMAEGIVLLNGNKVILSINPAALRLFGTDRSCEGKYILSVNRSLQLQELLQKAGDGRHAEMVMELNGGTYQLAASPVFSEGLVSGVVLLMLDVTEKEKTEQLRREFTANVSHELKTPLHTISGSAELMAEGMVRNEDIPVFSRRIYAESQRMIRLVEDIIRLSHLDEGAGDMKWEEMDLHALAEENINVLMPEAKKRGIQVDLAGETVWVRGIRQLVSGIFYNLIDNAIKYNHREGSVRVTVEAERAGASVCVADTGIGIPAEHQERIFERFYRVDKSHSKEIGGTGLGLSIVKHAAKLHGAAIQVDSIVGEGTAIKIHFTGILQ